MRLWDNGRNFLYGSTYVYQFDFLNSACFQYDECPQQLYKSNWYRWNKQNKDLLLLFVVLAGGEQSVGLFYPIKARLHDFLWVRSKVYCCSSIIFFFIFQFLKTLYSIAALLRSVYL